MSDAEAIAAIKAIISMLRDEIDLEQVNQILRKSTVGGSKNKCLN